MRIPNDDSPLSSKVRFTDTPIHKQDIQNIHGNIRLLNVTREIWIDHVLLHSYPLLRSFSASHTRRSSDALQAWARQPFCACGASPSAFSETWQTQPALRFSTAEASSERAVSFEASPAFTKASAYIGNGHAHTVPLW